MQTDERIDCLVNQALEIVRRYDKLDYLKNADVESDVFHGGIFVYEILKQGVKIDVLKNFSELYKSSMSTETAKGMVDKIAERGIAEFLKSGR